MVGKHERGDIEQVPWLDKLVFSKIERMREEAADDTAYLYVTLPTFDFPVVFNQKPYVLEEKEDENPVENKHRRLVRSERHTSLDVELKPNASIRDELNVFLILS